MEHANNRPDTGVTKHMVEPTTLASNPVAGPNG